MEQENQNGSPENDNRIEANKESELHTQNSDTHSGSSHHHGHHHSHHSSHSHSHSHRRRHHSSHHSSNKKSLLDKMQSWVERKFGSKGIIVISLVLILAIVVTVLLINFIEFNPFAKNSNNNNQDANASSDTPNYSQSATVEIPLYWKKMLESKASSVNTLQTAGGIDSVSFVWASDTHIPDNHEGRTNDIGKLMAKMLDDCNIPFAVLTGDIGTRATYPTEEAFAKTQDKISDHLAPLWGTDRLLVALGNHDGCYGDVEIGASYRKQYSPEKMWDMFFRQQALDSRREFSDDGSYFFVDNTAQKTRFIILNSQFGGEYLTDRNGWAKNDRFAFSCYGEEQLKWLANVALDMPEGYGALIFTHVPPKVLLDSQTEPYTVDCAQLRGIIDAYNNKTVFRGSYTKGVDGWSNSSIDVDFKGAKGEVIALFAGHVHHDSIDTATMSCPIITILSAGAPDNVDRDKTSTRTPGTDNETSFDVVTINRKTRTIYCTRVGAGADRQVQY